MATNMKRKKKAEVMEDDGSMTLTGHLKELRNRLIICAVVFVVGVVVSLAYADRLIDLLTAMGRDYYQFVSIAPQEKLMQYFRVSGGVTTAAMKKMITMATPRACFSSWGLMMPILDRMMVISGISNTQPKMMNIPAIQTTRPVLEWSQQTKGGERMHPLAEYPRPAMRRDSCEILNGPWQYAITQTAEYPAAWQGSILVPYSPEAPASGVGRTLQPGQWLHYHRLFAPPAGEGGRVLLHFGAVDYACAVQVNGHLAGGHRGGYWPFTLDITGLLNGTGRNSLWVAVQDPTGHGTQARGKQTLKPGGMFYPAQSGIWQTVWLERVPDNYIQTLTVTPDYDARTVTVRVHTAKPGGAVNLWAMVRAGGVTIAEDWGSDEADQDGEVTLNIPEEHFFPWSPDTPFLYDLTVGTNQGEEAEFDTVHSYFALRKWSCAPDAHGVLRFCLNDKPILLNGLLDQGYWPEGLYTPPSDAAVERELSEVKALGFNLLRKHAKIEPQRWYYHCDRLGLIVWQDIVNGGSAYNLWFVTYLTNALQPLLRRFPDGKACRRLLSRAKPAGREEYAHELADTVQALRCHPCIACWVPFNEGWGQFDAGKAVQALRTLDGTRLVDEASGWFDQGGGDVHSLHNYFYPLRIRPQKRTVALSEYGGIAWPMPGHEPPRKTYGYGTAKDRQELTARYKKLQLKTVLPQLEKGLSALVYTQLTDVEDEVNGLFTYDRAAVKPDANAVRSVNAALAAEFARVTNPAKK